MGRGGPEWGPRPRFLLLLDTPQSRGTTRCLQRESFSKCVGPQPCGRARKREGEREREACGVEMMGAGPGFRPLGGGMQGLGLRRGSQQSPRLAG